MEIAEGVYETDLAEAAVAALGDADVFHSASRS